MHDNIWQTYLYTCVTPKRSLFYTIVHTDTDTDTDSDADAAVAVSSAQKTGFSLCVFAVCFFFVTYLRNFTFVFFRKLMTFAQLRAASRSKRKQDADKKIENRDKATANALALFAQISR